MVSVLFCRLDVVANQASASNDFANEEESVDFGKDDAALCKVAYGQALPSIDVQVVLDGLLCLVELFAGGEAHAFFGIHLLGDFAGNLEVIHDRLLQSCTHSSIRQRKPESDNYVHV